MYEELQREMHLLFLHKLLKAVENIFQFFYTHIQLL